MTRASLDKQVDGFLNKVLEANNLDPRIEVKGGQLEVAHSLLFLALRQLGPEIVAATKPPVATVEV